LSESSFGLLVNKICYYSKILSSGDAVMDVQSEVVRVQGFVDKGNYHAAINLSISAMNQCRRDNDQPGTDYFIILIKNIVNKMADEFASQ